MTNTLQKTPREGSIEKGKQIVIALIVYFILNEIFSLIIKLLSGQAITVDTIRFGLTIVLCVYLYKGQNWAKLLLSFGATLWLFISIYLLYLQWSVPTISNFYFVLFFILTVLQGTAAYLLIFSNDVDEFFKSRKV